MADGGCGSRLAATSDAGALPQGAGARGMELPGGVAGVSPPHVKSVLSERWFPALDLASAGAAIARAGLSATSGCDLGEEAFIDLHVFKCNYIPAKSRRVSSACCREVLPKRSIGSKPAED